MCESPEVDQDPQYIMTPRPDDKYSKINQEFNMMMHRSAMNNRVRHHREKGI